MGDHNASVNPQVLARQYSRGDIVAHVSAPQHGLRVVAVWDGIGMVDVLSAMGQKRIPAEELSLAGSSATVPPEVELDSSTAIQWCSVSRGQSAQNIRKLASEFLKKGLYWSGVDRKYRPTRAEKAQKVQLCPKCCVPMKPTRYKRREGLSERLLACPTCLFLIKPCDIEGGD